MAKTMTQKVPDPTQTDWPDIRNNMALLFSGKLVSDLATQLYAFVVGLYVLKVTGSAMSFATVLVFNFLPRILIGPVAGVLADRFDRKKIVVSMDLISGFTLLLLFWISHTSGLHLSYIYATSALLAVCNTWFDVSLSASIPNLVNDGRINTVNSYNQTITSVAQIMAPVLGGVIFGLIDVRLFLLFSGLAFLVSAITEMFLNFSLFKDESPREDKRKKIRVFKEMMEGFNYIKKQQSLLIIFSFALVVNFLIAIGIEVPVPYIVLEVKHLTSEQFGMIAGAFPVGSLIGSLLLTRLSESQRKSLFIPALIVDAIGIVLCAVPGIPTLMLNTGSLFIWYILLYFILGVVVVFVNVPIANMIMRMTEDYYRGRIFGLLRSLSTVITPLGFFLSGLLIEEVPVYILPLLMGILQLIMVIWLSGRNIVKAI